MSFYKSETLHNGDAFSVVFGETWSDLTYDIVWSDPSDTSIALVLRGSVDEGAHYARLSDIGTGATIGSVFTRGTGPLLNAVQFAVTCSTTNSVTIAVTGK